MKQRRCGIYKIINHINGKYYVGSTEDSCRRWKEHKSALVAGRHYSPHLQNAWNKYGEENFAFVWVEDVPVEQLLDIENIHIAANPDGYNVAKYADAPGRGRVWTEQSRRKLSEAKMGHPVSDEARQKLRQANLGKKYSEETRRKVSAAGKGKKRSEETRRRISDALKSRPISEETRRKMSAARKYKPLTQEHKDKIRAGVKAVMTDEVRRKISESQKGKRLSEEHIRKMVAFHTGRKRSPETCQKISEALRKRHAARLNTAEGL
jgi:group I intron endonuclease